MRFSNPAVQQSLFATIVFVAASSSSSPSWAKAVAIVDAAAAADVDPPLPREDSAANKKDVTDAGILTHRALRATPPTCAAGYVNCVDGFVNDGNGNPTTTYCETACGGNCCVGDYDPCFGFTGQVCKDGSCNGDFACSGAKIQYVVNSCKVYSACRKTGNNGGTVGNIINSCTANFSCEGLGREGTAGNIQDSCNAFGSCFNAGGNKGSIGSMTASCNAPYACYGAGKTAASAITSDLNGCCNTDKSCKQFSEAAFQAALASVCPVREVQCVYIMRLTHS